MSSPIGHSLSGLLLYVATVRAPDLWRRWRWALVCVFFAVLPDLDFLPAAFGSLEMANEMHRSATHTLLFAILAVAAAYGLARLVWLRPTARAMAVLLACLLVHLALDVVTVDLRPPKGIALFEPFSHATVYAPIPFFTYVRKTSYADLISVHNLGVALREAAFFGALIALVLLLKRRRHRAAEPLPDAPAPDQP